MASVAEKKPKILLVDDEATLLLFYKAELREEGYDVITASNGERALDLFEGEHPDIVTLDIVMPEVRDGRLQTSPDPVGIQLLKKMKAINSSIPIIMLSAYDYTDTMDGLPSDGYVMKSSNTGELKRTLKELSKSVN